MVSEVSRLFVGQDFDAIGSITVNGQTSAAVELDMESLEDKPWRKVKSMQQHNTYNGALIEWLLVYFSFSNLVSVAWCRHHRLLQLRLQRGHLGSIL